MSFLTYDIVFFLLFAILIGIFFHKKRKNFKIEGILYLYRTNLGIKIIEKFSKRFSKLLKPMQYLVLVSGYSLMILMLWFLVKFAYFYFTSAFAVKAIKIPVIFPLVPYLPEIFKLDFLPHFYFTYWIIIIAIIAIPHEFAHGIFARLNKVKIHSTGFGFMRFFKLPTPFLAAFVEQDDKEMAKASKFSQLSILAAGTFANVLVMILFILIMWAFFSLAFYPAGVNFNAYSSSLVGVDSISKINNFSIDNSTNITSLLNVNSPNLLDIGEETYTVKNIISNDRKILGFEVYDNSPAFKSKLKGPILEIDGEKTVSYESLRSAILSHKPGDSVILKTLENNTVKDYNLTLIEKEGKPFLGIGINPVKASGFLGWIFNIISSVKDPLIYYKSSLGDFGIFIYDLLWWIVIVSISAALTNMLPVGIFDGGRFFMLTVWGITGKKRAGEIAFSISTWLILALILLLMLRWVFGIF